MYLPNLTDVSFWLLLITTLLVAFYFYATSYVGMFKAVGIPGPTPRLIINHQPELSKHGLSKMLDEWRKAYGNTFGFYGLYPRRGILVTFDSKLLQHILVKDFNNFADRASREVTLSLVMKGLFSSTGDRWRRSRHVMTPMFTVGRLKQMLYHVNTSSSKFVELVKSYKEQGKLIPLKGLAARYTSDVIARVGFGIDSKALTDENSEFAHHIEHFIRIPPNRLTSFFRNVGEFIPLVMSIGLRLFNQQVDAILPATETYFVNTVKESIERKTKGHKQDLNKRQYLDMLDLLLEAEVEGERAKNISMEDRKIVREEVIGNAIILILAAFETTSTALSSILYLLAHHEDVQNRVIEEIQKVMNGKTEPVYEDLAKLEYMTQVIYESLRMFPPSPDVTRVCNKTKTYDGVTIPAGAVVFIPTYKIIKDPAYFPNPEKFDPDRFSRDRKQEIDPVTFLPFGYGRRQCVAKRLALMELKVVLCGLLSQMKFVQTDQTTPPKGFEAEYTRVDGFFIAKKPLEMDIILREK